MRRHKKADEPADKTRADLLLAAIVEHLPAMLFVKDAETLRFVLFNREGERLLGWRREDLVGKSDRDFFPEEEARFFEEKDRAVLETGALVEIAEEPIRTRTGERILYTKKIPIFGPDGKALYLLGISQDITEWTQVQRERAQLVARLEAAVRARDDLLAIVSHDLKNPVASILLNTELLARPAPAGDEAARFRDAALRIRHAAQRMNVLIGNLLDAAAIEAGRFPFVGEEVEVGPLIDDALELEGPSAVERGLRIELRLADSLPRVRCDRDRVLQVFDNLIGNAIKFTAPGGAIAVSAQPEGSVVRFSVSDTGPGIAKELLPHVFERYWRANPSSTMGSGLGLYIVRGIVEAHGGTVAVDSCPGCGSSFSFTLPMAD